MQTFTLECDFKVHTVKEYDTDLISSDFKYFHIIEVPDIPFVKRQIINERVRYLPKKPKFDDIFFQRI